MHNYTKIGLKVVDEFGIVVIMFSLACLSVIIKVYQHFNLVQSQVSLFEYDHK